MPSFWSRLTGGARQALTGPLKRKASATGQLVALHHQGQPVWTPRDYEALAREGFARNPIVYRCTRMIAEATASLHWLAYEGAKELDNHPLLALIAKPNAQQSGPDLFEALFGYLLLAGNGYLEAILLEDDLRELHALRPDRMKIIPGRDGWPEAYEYTAGGQSVRFAGHPDLGISPILHVTMFNPVDDHYGMSPLEAAQIPIDIHNAAGAWNKSLLDNAARPSGALVYAPSDRNSTLTSDQYDRLKAELESNFQGSTNAGRPLLLEGGLDWKSMGLSPRDMDFIDAKHAAAREIALAFGVPPMLLGIPGDNTYSNYAEANRTFWRQTVLPLAERVAKAICCWLSPVYGDELRLGFDLDRVDALALEREKKWSRIGAANFLTANEKREALGYGPIEGGDHPPALLRQKRQRGTAN